MAKVKKVSKEKLEDLKEVVKVKKDSSPKIKPVSGFRSILTLV